VLGGPFAVTVTVETTANMGATNRTKPSVYGRFAYFRYFAELVPCGARRSCDGSRLLLANCETATAWPASPASGAAQVSPERVCCRAPSDRAASNRAGTAGSAARAPRRGLQPAKRRTSRRPRGGVAELLLLGV
jgi:hypothetical protein